MHAVFDDCFAGARGVAFEMLEYLDGLCHFEYTVDPYDQAPDAKFHAVLDIKKSTVEMGCSGKCVHVIFKGFAVHDAIKFAEAAQDDFGDTVYTLNTDPVFTCELLSGANHTELHFEVDSETVHLMYAVFDDCFEDVDLNFDSLRL
jgi:hypothetical protein